MKIVNICLSGPFSDGWNYQENLLSKYQKRIVEEVYVITSLFSWNNKGTLEIVQKTDYINEDGVHIIRIPISKGKGFNSKFKRFIGLYDLLEQLSPDILFVHGCQFRDISTIVKYLKKHADVVVYIDNHADFSNSATNWISKNILHKIIWRYYAHKINPFVKKWYGVLPARVDFLRNVYGLPSEKIEYLPMGADNDLVEEYSSSKIRSEYRKKYGISDDDILLVTGGKIDLAKKQTLLLMDAVNQIDNPKLQLIIFGSVVPELKNDVENRCSKKVKYIGWLSSEESYSHFAMADLVVFPGRHSVFWEQVAGQGIPMVVKFWQGTTHIDLGGNVKFLYKDSVEEIISVLRSVIDKNIQKEMTELAREKSCFFSYSEIAQMSIECQK